MQPWSEKLRGRQRGGREEEIQGRRGFNTSVEGVCVSIRGGHTVRFESVRSKKKEISLTQKGVKSCYTGVLFRGKPLECFLSGRFGTQWRTPMDSLHQGFGGKKSRKRNYVQDIKKKRKRKKHCLDQ